MNEVGSSIIREKNYVVYQYGKIYAAFKEGDQYSGYVKVPTGQRFYSLSCAEKDARSLSENTPVAARPVLDSSNYIIRDVQLSEAAAKLPEISDIFENTLNESPEHYRKILQKRSSQELNRGSIFYGGSPADVRESLQKARWRVDQYDKNKGIVRLKTGDLTGICSAISAKEVKKDDLIYPVYDENNGEISFLLLSNSKHSIRKAYGNTMIVSVKDIKTGETNFSKASCIDFFPGRDIPSNSVDRDSEYFEKFYNKMNQPVSIQDLRKNSKASSKKISYIVSNLKLVDQNELEYYLGKPLEQKAAAKPEGPSALRKLLTRVIVHFEKRNRKNNKDR